MSHISRRFPPLFLPAVALTVGILSVRAGATAPLVYAAPALAAILLLLRQRSVGLLAMWLAIGMLTAMVHAPGRLPASLRGVSTHYEGVIKAVDSARSGANLTVEIKKAGGRDVPGFLARIFVPSGSSAFAPYREIRFSGHLDPLPAYQPSLPDERNFTETLERRGIFCSGIVAPDSLTVGGEIRSAGAFFYRLNTGLRNRISWMPVSSGTSSFFLATLTADDDWLTREARQRFSLTGTAHVLALSGMHVAIITSLLLILLLPLALIDRSKWKWPVVIAVLWLFALMTGMPASVVRAVIMATIIGIGSILERRPYPLNSLFAAAIIILLFAPDQLFSLGFQLSFLAVGGILILSRPLNPFSRNGHPGFISQTIFATIAATITTAPLSAYCFHTLPFYFILSNFVLLIILPVMMYGAILLLLLNFAGFHAYALGEWLDRIYSWVTLFLDKLVSLPGGAIGSVIISPVTLAVTYGAILLLAIGLHATRRRAWLTSALIFALLAIALPTMPSRPSQPVTHLYIPAVKSETLVLVHRDTRLVGCSSLVPRLTEAREIADRRWADFMLKRGIDSLQVVAAGSRSELLQTDGDLIRAGGRNLLLLSHNPDSVPALHIDYLVVSRGMTLPIRRLVETIAPDTVVLACDLDPRRAERYQRELMRASIPVVRPPVTLVCP